MKRSILAAAFLLIALTWLSSCASNHEPKPAVLTTAMAQVPTWSPDDMDFFLHGSMTAEFVPEPVLHSFMHIYPDLFPTSDLSNLGLIPDPAFGWPIGFSRARPAHLAGMSSVGINCASCHLGEVESPNGNERIRVLGMTSHFNVEGLFSSVIVSTFRTADPASMKRFLAEYLDQTNPEPDAAKRAQRTATFNSTWQQQEEKIVAAIKADPAGARGAGPGGLQKLDSASLQLDARMLADDSADLARLSTSMLKLFHNMRAALHVPDQPPAQLPPPSGPGRNDAFGLLSAALLNAPLDNAPVKYGLVWNVEHRYWVHWDGDTRSPIARNMLAALGLGAPLIGREAKLDYALLQRQTDLTEKIAAPKYPFSVDRWAAQRGAPLYQQACAPCHEGPQDDHRLRSTVELWTDPLRARLFTKIQADRFNKFLSELQMPGLKPTTQPGVRSTQKYWAADLAGVWARSPYLHNGSIRTMQELLTTPASRPVTFQRGSQTYDGREMGYIDAGWYLFDTRIPGNANTGHDFGTGFSSDQKHDLIEYLKTL